MNNVIGRLFRRLSVWYWPREDRTHSIEQMEHDARRLDERIRIVEAKAAVIAANQQREAA